MNWSLLNLSTFSDQVCLEFIHLFLAINLFLEATIFLNLTRSYLKQISDDTWEETTLAWTNISYDAKEFTFLDAEVNVFESDDVVKGLLFDFSLLFLLID